MESKEDKYPWITRIERARNRVRLNPEDATAYAELGKALYYGGKFCQAKEAFQRALELDNENYEAIAGRGKIAAREFDFEKAKRLLYRALKRKPDDIAVLRDISLIYYHQDNFLELVKMNEKILKSKYSASLEGRTELYKSFGNAHPYRIRWKESKTSCLKFYPDKPLPVLKVSIDDHEPVYMILDTGGSSIYLETTYANELGLKIFKGGAGLYAGGKRIQTNNAKVTSLTIGSVVVRNIPALVRDFIQVRKDFDLDNLVGIMGINVLQHFLATIDYPNQQLILQPKLKKGKKYEAVSSGKVFRVPFFVLGDHFIISYGTINEGEPISLFVDIGFTSGGFLAPKSTLEKYRIKVDKSTTFPGGYHPFMVESINFGGARREKIKGWAGVFPSQLEFMLGFRIAGLISNTFFHPYRVTFDFTHMELILEERKAYA